MEELFKPNAGLVTCVTMNSFTCPGTTGVRREFDSAFRSFISVQTYLSAFGPLLSALKLIYQRSGSFISVQTYLSALGLFYQRSNLFISAQALLSVFKHLCVTISKRRKSELMNRSDFLLILTQSLLLN
ncbi:hypothetical protein [Alkalibacillus silvisoli]|uniref:hypothetical protein n=1 Tax=Alkalibacillus silvisoli TaxID=392823 RepID=UPI0031CFA4B7